MENDAPSPVTHIMIDAALKAAHVALLRRKETGFHADEKDDDCGVLSLVTKGDLQSEQIVRATLEDAKPRILEALGLPSEMPVGFIMEEDEHSHPQNLKEQRRRGLNFVVDPIDGTLGYSYPRPQKDQYDQPNPWCVSIGLELDGKTIASAVYEAGEKEWQVTADRKQMDFDPDHPGGKIFWAEKDKNGAYRIDAPESGFAVTRPNQELYEEVETLSGTDRQVKLIQPKHLASELNVDYSRGTVTRLDKDTPVQKDAPIDMGDFKADRDAKDNQHGEIISAVRDTVKRLGREEVRSLSAVASCLRVADGRSAGFAHGCFYPWDDSAARLILEKSGAAYTQYETPHSNDQMTTLAISREPIVYTQLKNTLTGTAGITGDVVGHANTPLAARVEATPAALAPEATIKAGAAR
jgi:fructose-1,6-bisphosphatase/inositol monophosphatase family enzyme